MLNFVKRNLGDVCGDLAHVGVFGGRDPVHLLQQFVLLSGGLQLSGNYKRYQIFIYQVVGFQLRSCEPIVLPVRYVTE